MESNDCPSFFSELKEISLFLFLQPVCSSCLWGLILVGSSSSGQIMVIEKTYVTL